MTTKDKYNLKVILAYGLGTILVLVANAVLLGGCVWIVVKMLKWMGVL